ncbi:MAG TPA: sensor domain-containing diguanylate cyclase [Candidatus Latescibacteria bacterium]|nr:sensor domain-containing diguanylate cyclase [Candidatus Latescibacterota bacterium]
MAEKQPKGPKWPPPDAPDAPAARVAVDRYKALVEQLPVGVYRTTPDGVFIEANAVLVTMLGHKRRPALFKCNVNDYYVKGDDRSRTIKTLSSRTTSFQEFELRRVDGRRFWVRDYCRAVKGPDGSIRYLDGILVDITGRKTAERKLELANRKLRTSNEKLESQSLNDHLTGLHNRRGFFTFGLQQMKIAKRLKEDNYLLFLDIDNLKEVNDAHGHAVGDLLLQGVATILRSTLRESDVIGRIGGDEFAVLAMRSKGVGERSLLARIEEGVQGFRLKKYGHLRLSMSMGLVRVDPQKYQQLDDFLAHADFLMYQQKRSKERQETHP